MQHAHLWVANHVVAEKRVLRLLQESSQDEGTACSLRVRCCDGFIKVPQLQRNSSSSSSNIDSTLPGGEMPHALRLSAPCSGDPAVDRRAVLPLVTVRAC